MAMAHVGAFLVLLMFSQFANASGEGIKDRLGKPLVKVNNEIDELKRSQKTQKSQIIEFGEAIIALSVSDPGVYFKVSPTVNYAPAVNAKIIFDDVKENIGSAFDPSSSVFTAPISGIYEFAVLIGTSGNGNTDFAVLINDVQEYKTTSNSGWFSTSLTVITHLSKGHQVSVKKSSQASTSVRAGPFTNFSGFLLRADS